MKVVYTYKEGTKPIYVEGTEGTRRVLIVFKDGLKTVVYYCDDLNSQVFINEVISPTMLGFTMSNFKRIESDEEFRTYSKYITDNYNYSGEHITEKTDGNDL